MNRVIVVKKGFPRTVIAAGLRGAPGGTVTLTGGDVTTALGYTPQDPANLAVVATTGQYADLLGSPSIPAGPGDINAATAAQGELATTAVQPEVMNVALELKVDKVEGYGLSQRNFTPEEKEKLAGLGSGSAWGGITGALADQTDLQAALNAKVALAGLPGRTVNASGAITPADVGRWIVCTNSSAITLTIGAEATAAWPATGIPTVNILRLGSGAVTVTGNGFSVATHSTDTNVLDGVVAAATAVRSAANTWALIGRLVAA